MPVSPSQGTEGDVALSLFIDGSGLADTIEVLSVEVTLAIDQVSSARIVISGDEDDETLSFAPSDAFAPGKAIQIKAGYGSSETVIFEGLVSGLGVRFGASGRTLAIECHDQAIFPAAANDAARLSVTYGVDLIDFEADLEAGPRVRGHMRFQGSALARPGVVVEVHGCGKWFDGNACLDSVTHTIADGNWITRAGFGMPAEGASEGHALAAKHSMSAENFTKAIVTRDKLAVEFDDSRKVITIVTPGQNKIVLSDDGRSIQLIDQHLNEVTLSAQGIALDSQGDIRISASGKLTLSAAGDIELSGMADLQLQALNITNSASMGFRATGAASAELSAAGLTTVKGAMIMIN